MGNSAPILMVLSCACAAEPIAKRPTAAALTKRVRNAFMLSSPSFVVGPKPINQWLIP